MKLVNPVFYSYLGFGLKAARLATLGALETEGSSGYRCWLGYGESDTNTQLAFYTPWQGFYGGEGYAAVGSICCKWTR